MMNDTANMNTGMDGEEHFSLSLEEISCSFGVSETIIIEIVNEGIVTPLGNDTSSWQFGHDEVGLVRKALQLNRDLGVNMAGAGLAILLLEEIDRLNALMQIMNER